NASRASKSKAMHVGFAIGNRLLRSRLRSRFFGRLSCFLQLFDELHLLLCALRVFQASIENSKLIIRLYVFWIEFDRQLEFSLSSRIILQGQIRATECDVHFTVGR